MGIVLGKNWYYWALGNILYSYFPTTELVIFLEVAAYQRAVTLLCLEDIQ